MKIGLDILHYEHRFFPRYIPSKKNTTLVDSSVIAEEQQEKA